MSSSNHYYPQVSVPSRDGQAYEYPQRIDVPQRSHRTHRYPQQPRQRRLSKYLPPINATGRFSEEIIEQLEDAYFMNQDEEEKTGRDNSFDEIMRTGTDSRGRRELEKQYSRLDLETKQSKEIYLAQLSGFIMRSDGKLDYGTSSWSKIKCVVM